MSLKKFNDLKRQVKEANPKLDNYGVNFITSIVYKEEKNGINIRENTLDLEISPDVYELTGLDHNMSAKQIWGKSKEQVIMYMNFLRKFNNSKSTKTLMNIRYLQKTKGFLATRPIKLANVDGEWYLAN